MNFVDSFFKLSVYFKAASKQVKVIAIHIAMSPARLSNQKV